MEKQGFDGRSRRFWAVACKLQDDIEPGDAEFVFAQRAIRFLFVTQMPSNRDIWSLLCPCRRYL